MLRDGRCRPLGRITDGCRAGRGIRRQRRWVGVEAEANLAAALVDERREPVGKRSGQPPLTRDFSPAPAENLGTRPPGIVIRSPVRGFTP
jgi:hypothetical protein